MCDTVHFGTWERTIWTDQPPPFANTEHVDNTLTFIHSVQRFRYYSHTPTYANNVN
jgi:hypothetical protein